MKRKTKEGAAKYTPIQKVENVISKLQSLLDCLRADSTFSCDLLRSLLNAHGNELRRIARKL